MPQMLYRANPARTSRVSSVLTSRGAPQVAVTEQAARHAPQAREAGRDREKESAAEVRVLANEVWSILKRKISAERDRMGLR